MSTGMSLEGPVIEWTEVPLSSVVPALPVNGSVPLPVLIHVANLRTFSIKGWPLPAKALWLFLVTLLDVTALQALLPESRLCTALLLPMWLLLAWQCWGLKNVVLCAIFATNAVLCVVFCAWPHRALRLSCYGRFVAMTS